MSKEQFTIIARLANMQLRARSIAATLGFKKAGGYLRNRHVSLNGALRMLGMPGERFTHLAAK